MHPFISNPVLLCHDARFGLCYNNEFADVPVCKSKGPVVHGVGKGEMVDVLCQVTANPVTNVKFHWTFNNSADFIHVPGTTFSGKISIKIKI